MTRPLEDAVVVLALFPDGEVTVQAPDDHNPVALAEYVHDVADRIARREHLQS